MVAKLPGRTPTGTRLRAAAVGLVIIDLARYPERMPGDTKLVVLMAALHLVGLVFVAVLLVMFLRSDTSTGYRPPDDPNDGDGGGNDRRSPSDLKGPSGDGLPLPDAAPARVRLRDHSRPGERQPRPDRRRSDEPERSPRRLPAG